MKILYTITKAEIGGAQTHTLHLMRAMVEKGDQVALMTQPNGWLVDEAKKIGVHVFSNPYLTNRITLWSVIRAFGVVRTTVKKWNPDIVSCHSSVAGAITRLAVGRCVPTVYTAHGWAFTEKAPFLRRVLAVISETILAFFTNEIICVSECDRTLALKYKIVKKEKITVIYNAVPSRGVVSTHQNERVQFISLGRLAYPKECLLLAEVFAGLSAAYKKQAQLLFVGDGPLRENLERIVERTNSKDSITIAGTIPYDRISEVLGRSDCLVLVSKHEGFPMVILEAMDAHLPVIASLVGGIPEIVTSENGILVENTKVSLQNALEQLIANKTKISGLGARAFNTVSTKFSFDTFVQKTQEVYQRVTLGS